MLKKWTDAHIAPVALRHWRRMASTWAMTIAAGLTGLLAIWQHFDGVLPEWLFVGLAFFGPMVVYGARVWNQNLEGDTKGPDIA